MQTHFGHQSLLNPCFDRKIAFRTYASSISTPERQQSQNGGSRRQLLQSAASVVLLASTSGRALAEEGPVVRLDLAPDQSKYNAADENLRDAAYLLQKALNAEQVQEEERLWTELIDKYQDSEAPWKADVVGRAYGNRGNSRSRQGRMEEALADFNVAIQLCPWSVDPLLNRGVVYEALGRYDDAVTDYRAVLKAQPNDPSGWNNLGNCRMAQGAWQDAADFYGKAYKLAPGFSFAAANQSLALYQLGKTNEATRTMKSLLRRYPDFPDIRAALTAASWRAGDLGEAESNWSRVEDPRYGDPKWLERWRRWPPQIRADLENFLNIRASSPIGQPAT